MIDVGPGQPSLTQATNNNKRRPPKDATNMQLASVIALMLLLATPLANETAPEASPAPPPDPNATTARQRTLQCVANYSSALAFHFAADAAGRSALRKRIAASFRARDDDARRGLKDKPNASLKELVLGIGPGSSGTRSTFMAMALLDFAAQHYKVRYVPRGCAWRQRVPTKRPDPIDDRDTMYWGDTPVFYAWPNLWRRLPNARFLMTDVDADRWRDKRLSFRRGYCAKSGVRADCLVPLAFAPDRRLMKTFDLNSTSRDACRGAWAALRGFARCAIPPERLLWMNLAEAAHPGDLWAQLLDFLGLDDSAELRDPRSKNGSAVVLARNATPFPHWGEHNCDMGGVNCKEWLPCATAT